MALTYTYTDALLKGRMTEAIEDRAVEEVENLITPPEPWKGKLVVNRGYQILCLELIAKEDDVFDVKLRNLRKDWDFILASAKKAIADAETDPSKRPSFFTIPIARA